MSESDNLLKYRLERLEATIKDDRERHAEALKEKAEELDKIKQEVRDLSDALRLAKIVARLFGAFIVGGALFMDQLQLWINRLFGR